MTEEKNTYDANMREIMKQFSSRPIAYHKIFTDVVGSLTGGVLLSQIVYWSSAMHNQEFYKTDDDFANEIGMGIYELRGAKALLKKLGLIEIVRKGIPAKTHYTLNKDNLTTALMKVIEMGGEAMRKHLHSIGFIYLAKLNKLIKIGRTSNIQRRRKELKDTIPGIELIYHTESQNTIKDERKLHKLFENKRVEKEWFDLSEEDIQMIKSMQMSKNKSEVGPNTIVATGPDTGSKSGTNTIIKTTTETKDKEEKNITLLDSFPSKSKKESVEVIFDFWNDYKSSGKWQAHRKLNKDMIAAILLNLEHYSVLEICGAVSNYALVLQNDKYYWDYVWPLSIFLTVKTGKCKDDPKKWWRFLEENFIEETYLSRYNGNSSSSPKQDEPPHDPDPELTELVIETYRKVYRPRGEFPNQTALRHFRLISTKAKKTYKLDSTSSKKTFVEEFFQIAHDTWSSKGEEVMPWDLSGTMMWDYKIPQYYQNMGVPEALIGEVNGG